MIGTILGLARAALGAVSSIMGYFTQRRVDKRAKLAAKTEWLEHEQDVVRKAAEARHRADGVPIVDRLRDDPARRP